MEDATRRRSWFFLAPGAVVIGVLIARTRIEEEKLLQRFGADYRDFMARTGRFFPRWTGRSLCDTK